MYNLNWNRWLRASVVKHFTEGIPPVVVLENLFVEGEVRERPTKDTYIEIRMDGPKWREYGRDDFLLIVEVNLLLTIIIDSTKNLYKPEVIVGKINELISTIPVFKLGGESGDDQSQIGCLEMFNNEPRDWTVTSDFGQIDVVVALRQMSVEAHYKIELEGV